MDTRLKATFRSHLIYVKFLDKFEETDRGVIRIHSRFYFVVPYYYSIYAIMGFDSPGKKIKTNNKKRTRQWIKYIKQTNTQIIGVFQSTPSI